MIWGGKRLGWGGLMVLRVGGELRTILKGAEKMKPGRKVFDGAGGLVQQTHGAIASGVWVQWVRELSAWVHLREEGSGQVRRAGGARDSPKKGGRWATASRKGPVSICRSAGSGLSRCSASSAISGSRPLVMPQPAPRASAPGLSPPAASRDASVATSARASQRAPSAARRPGP